MQWCGLKCFLLPGNESRLIVTTDAVVWIEIIEFTLLDVWHTVTTDAVVWIEIHVIA